MPNSIKPLLFTVKIEDILPNRQKHTIGLFSRMFADLKDWKSSVVYIIFDIIGVFTTIYTWIK